MLKPWQVNLLVVLTVLACAFAFSFGFSPKYQICTPSEYTHAKECTEHYLGPFVFLTAVVALDAHNGLVTALATVFVAGFTWTLWRTSKQQGSLAQQSINLARDDFNATHRPWIPINNASPGAPGLVWADGNALIGLKLSYTNTGNSPARHVLIRAEAFAFLRDDEISSRIEALKQRPIAADSRPRFERTLFPNVPTEAHRVVMIPKAAFLELKDSRGGPAIEMVPVIIGVIEYYFPFGDHIPHYTPFAYHVWRTEPGNEDSQMTFMLGGARVPANEITFRDLIDAGPPN